VIEDKILCVHSGIGNIRSLGELEAIERPTTVQKHKAVVDILWSSTSPDSRDIMGYNPTKVTDHALESFLEHNGLITMIRSRESIFEGYEADNSKISIFSVSNYGKNGGSAAILKITKGLDLVPHVLPPAPSTRGAWMGETVLKTGIVYTE